MPTLNLPWTQEIGPVGGAFKERWRTWSSFVTPGAMVIHQPHCWILAGDIGDIGNRPLQYLPQALERALRESQGCDIDLYVTVPLANHAVHYQKLFNVVSPYFPQTRVLDVNRIHPAKNIFQLVLDWVQRQKSLSRLTQLRLSCRRMNDGSQQVIDNLQCRGLELISLVGLAVVPSSEVGLQSHHAIDITLHPSSWTDLVVFFSSFFLQRRMTLTLTPPTGGVGWLGVRWLD